MLNGFAPKEQAALTKETLENKERKKEHTK